MHTNRRSLNILFCVCRNSCLGFSLLGIQGVAMETRKDRFPVPFFAGSAASLLDLGFQDVLRFLLFLFFFFCSLNEMNGEIPSIPIITLAGVSSLTNRMLTNCSIFVIFSTQPLVTEVSKPSEWWASCNTFQ